MSDALAYLQQGAKEPTLADQEKLKIDNLEYQEEVGKATPIKTDELQEGVKKSLTYGTFVPPKNNEANRVEGEAEELPDIDSERMEQDITQPYYPILSRFEESGKINPDQFDEILENLGIGLGYSDALEVGIDDIKILGELKDILNNLGNSEQAKQNTISFKNDFTQLAGMPIDVDGDRVISVLAEHYIKIDEAGTCNQDKDLSTSANEAANCIMKKHPSIPKDTVAFEKATNRLASNDHKEEYLGLQYLLNISSEEGGKGKKLTDAATKSIDNKDDENIQLLGDRVEELQKRLDDSKRDKLDKGILKDIREEIVAIKKEPKQDGDVFVAGKLDTMIAEIDQAMKEG